MAIGTVSLQKPTNDYARIQQEQRALEQQAATKAKPAPKPPLTGHPTSRTVTPAKQMSAISSASHLPTNKQHEFEVQKHTVELHKSFTKVQSAGQVAHNFPTWLDGSISRDDLEAVVHDSAGRYTDNEVKAARFFLDKNNYDRLDIDDSGKLNGLITSKDLATNFYTQNHVAASSSDLNQVDTIVLHETTYERPATGYEIGNNKKNILGNSDFVVLENGQFVQSNMHDDRPGGNIGGGIGTRGENTKVRDVDNVDSSVNLRMAEDSDRRSNSGKYVLKGRRIENDQYLKEGSAIDIEIDYNAERSRNIPGTENDINDYQYKSTANIIAEAAYLKYQNTGNGFLEKNQKVGLVVEPHKYVDRNRVDGHVDPRGFDENKLKVLVENRLHNLGVPKDYVQFRGFDWMND